jgi:hypothetical protein
MMKPPCMYLRPEAGSKCTANASDTNLPVMQKHNAVECAAADQ